MPGQVEHYYGGVYDHSDDLGAGLIGSATFGYAFDNGFAVEVDGVYLYRHELLDEDYITTFGAFANAKYSLAVTDAVSLYGALGLGILTSEDEIIGNIFTGLGYQVKLGAEFAATENLAVVGEYRLLGTLGPAFGPFDEGHSFTSHSFLTGVKVSF